ncbi:MAG: extracellular solute-binding protein [Clostridiales bacterium]|nr:extracellular solute-binding protein [Clostridiales bacterium]
MGKKARGVLIGLLCAAAIIVLLVVFSQGESNFRSKYEGVDLSTDVVGIGRDDTYDAYLAKHEGIATGAEIVEVDVTTFEGDGEARQEDGADCVYTPDNAYTTWKVTVEQEGMYTILLDYKTVESRGVDIERELYINGELPFAGAATLRFSRLWMDDPEDFANYEEGTYKKDNQGNDIRPSQIEYFDWQQSFCRDDRGYTVKPYSFYFQAGENTISLKAVNEPMILRSIKLVPVAEELSYDAYCAANPQVEMTEDAKNWSYVIQGEESSLRSSPSLYPRYDRASPATEPYSVSKTVLNYIGGDPWNTAGQWVEWDFEVPEDGYYNITIKARQAYQRGALSCRTLYIDGEVPFEDVSSIAFEYDTSWKMCTLSDENGTPYRFYLTKGTHTIRLEATLGEMGGILKAMEDSIFRLNQIYRKVLVLTGVNPDRFRDYNLAGVYPEVIDAMELESMRLYKLVDDTVLLTGQKSDRVAVAQTLAVQLEQFVDRNERITQSFTNFKDNITSLGTAMQNMAETKLDVDLIVISGENAKLPKCKDGGFARALHEIRACVSSYFVDYNNLGDVYDEEAEDVIEVWIVTGRDQSTVLKTMIDDTFTKETGIKVNVKLVQADAILTAVVAGNGPDVVLSVDGWFAVNYAMRNAVEDLTQFDDFEEVITPFYPSALEPLTYDNGTHKGVYGLPETQIFSVLFYREDVLEELGLEVPQTWDDIIAMLPTIQGNNMSVGVPFPDISNVDMSGFNALIYQNGGTIYSEDKQRTVIDSEAGVAAFKFYTSLYNDYGLPTVFDFVSRFRSGEMPIGVGQYTLYNTLAVSAPEIRGLWDFALYPGTLKEDGTIDRSVHANGLCCLMIATDNETVKANAWEFMKWWVSADAQVRFGREMESVLGSSARYSTANRDALRQLAWSADQLEVLEEQHKWARGFPEIAGGYSTTRHMTNAIRKVINDKDDPRETLLTYTRTINEEIRIKRREFGLPIDGEEGTK